MEKISAGYWKYTIDLGTATEATACFNNGNGTWDNKDKANYTLKAGTSLVSNANAFSIATLAASLSCILL